MEKKNKWLIINLLNLKGFEKEIIFSVDENYAKKIIAEFANLGEKDMFSVLTEKKQFFCLKNQISCLLLSEQKEKSAEDKKKLSWEAD